MDALTLLTGDHNRVRALAARFKEAHEGDDLPTATELAEKIFRELDVHTTIEETVFYPAVEGCSTEIRELVVEGMEEHGSVKRLMLDAKGLDPTDEHWAAKVTVVIEQVEHHAEEEEKEMFPQVRSAMDADALEKLASKLEVRKRELGAPTIPTIDLTKADLDEKARELDIPGRSKMTKDELLATVGPMS
jgi:hemerythrin superfamily protein